MIKKIVLLLTLILYSLFIKDAAFAYSKYAQDVYLDNLKKEVAINWIKPLNSGQKSAVVSCTLDQSGHIVNASILRTSNDYEFDKKAVEAVHRSYSFGPLVNNQKSLDVQVFFSSNFIMVSTNKQQDTLKYLEHENIVNVANKGYYVPYVKVSDYVCKLKSKINSNWNPKCLKRKEQAVVRIKIGNEGALESVKLIKSSRSRMFDRKVLEAISDSVPMGILPDNRDDLSTDVLLTFNYDRTKENLESKHYVLVKIRDLKGYDKYAGQIEQIISANLKGQRYYHYKDLVLELNITKTGRLKYVKIKKPSKDKNFDRKTLAILQKISFPPLSDSMGVDNITTNYEILTQRDHSFNDFVFDYLIYMGTTRLQSFCL